jgi:uncharacterized delta-60 repeat protein
LALVAAPLTAFAAGPEVPPGIVNQGAAGVADAYNGIVTAPDGSVYSVGYQVVDGTNRAVLVTKSNADGTLDTSFGTDGRAVIDLVSEFNAAITTNPGAKETGKGIAVDKLGRLLVVGEVEGDQSAAASAADVDVFVARVHPNGSLDRSYGVNGGWTRIPLSDGVNPTGAAPVMDAAGWDIFVRPNQKSIISVGIGTDSGADRTGRDAGAVQLTAAGRLDASFGDGGVATIPTPFSDNLRRGLLDDDGSYFTTSYANVGMNNQPFIQKFTPSGAPDESWGDDGLATTYPGGRGGFAEAYGIHKDADGNYIVSAYGYRGGREGAAAGNSVDALLFSLTPAGNLNTGWADRGLVAYHVGDDGNNSGDRHRDHAILPDGRVVGIGGTSGTSNALITITNPDGSPGTLHVVDLGGSDDYLWGITTVGNGYQVIAAGYGGGDAQLVTLDLTPAASATTVAAGNSAFGAANSATVTVAVAGSAAAGDVDVTLDGKKLATVAVAASGTATVALPSDLAVGSHTLAASYAGEVGVDGSEASSTFSVTKAASTSAVTLSKTSVNTANPATATVTVTAPGTPSAYQPTGSVKIYEGSKEIASATLKAADKGKVTVSLPKLKASSTTVKAVYAGDASVTGSEASGSLTITKVATKSTVQLSKSSVNAASQATATVKVTASDVPAGFQPVGTVKVYGGSKEIASVSLKAADKGTVKIKLPKLSVKSHTIKATFVGDADLAASSATAKLKVTKVSTKTTVKLSKSTIKATKQATATIKVKASSVPSGYKTTGTVKVYDGSKKIATVKVKAADKGTVKVKLPTLKAGSHKIKATYSGGADVAKSSATAKLKVTKK